MVKHLSMIEEWRRRLAGLSQGAGSTRESSWLQEVQAKVLRYFISRYEGDERFECEVPEIPSGHSSSRLPTATFSTTGSSLPGRTRKDRAEIRLLLERIREVNRSHLY